MHLNRPWSSPVIRERRRFTVLAAAAAGLALTWSGVAVAHALTPTEPAPVAAAPSVSPTPTPTVDSRLGWLPGRIKVQLLGAQASLATGTGKAPAEQIQALTAAIAAAQQATSSTDADAMAQALDVLTATQQAVETSTRAFDAAHPATPTPTPTPTPPAPKATSAPRNPAKVARPSSAPQSQQVAPAPQPEPVAVAAPAPAAPPPGPTKTADEWFAAALTGIGVPTSAFTISNDYAKCQQPDLGPLYVQGCMRTSEPRTIYMKDVAPEVAASEVARSVVLHEYSHLLQYRLGYQAVLAATDPIFGAGNGIEQSADCMAIALGATGKPGGYTSDCTGARGQIAADMVAGHLP